MISLLNVTKEYLLDGQTTITPVKDVTLEITKGEFILIIGRSGSGKTTLLNLAAGLVRPTAGTVSIEGINLHDMSDRNISALRGRKVGFVFQFPSLLSSLTVVENVIVPTMFSPNNRPGSVYTHAEELLRIVGLSERITVYPRQLSAGEQKRVVLARALINNPQVLLADEPTSDLDEQTEHEIMHILQEVHSKGVTVIMVTHSLELTHYATRVLKMEHGQIWPL